MYVELLFVLTVALFRVHGQVLIITGFGVVKPNKFFVELYASEAISDLSVYTLSTNRTYHLPSKSVRKGFILLGNKGITNEFFGNAYRNYFGHPLVTNVSLNYANDGIALISNSLVISS